MRQEPVRVAVFHLAAEFVDVGGLAVEQFAEHALADHVEVDEFLAAVVDVFHHHAVAAGGFRGIHDLPQFLQGVRDGHFAEGVGSGFHGRRRTSARGVPTGWR